MSSFVADGQEYVFNLAFLFLNNLEDIVRQYLKDVKAKVLHMKKVSSMQNESVLSPIIIYLFKLMRLPLVIMYYIYVMPFLLVSKKLWIYATLTIKIVCRRSPHARRIVEHIFALFVICKSVVTKILSSKVTELIAFCIITIFEIIGAVLWPADSEDDEKGLSMVLSVEELAELLEYEEIDGDNGPDTAESLQYPRALRGMHNYVPSNPFRATIRIHRAVPIPHRSGAAGHSTDLVATEFEPGSCLVDYNGADSPASFPPTPYSRANVMNRSLDRVASVMFAARDRLRLEAQSVSRDEYSRIVAKEAQSSGQFAVFDPKESSPGVALSCGNHCAIKVGKGLCCCCRSMMPVRTDTYVYFEFSVMVSSAQTPTLGIGLSPECPMNVMVGSWPRSKGFYNDGQMLVGSHWYQSTNGKRIEAGSTVGMLVYIPSAECPPLPENPHEEEEGEGDSSRDTSSKEHERERELLDLSQDSAAKGQAGSFFGSFLSGFSRSSSLDHDESFGLALSGDESSSSSSSASNSPTQVKAKGGKGESKSPHRTAPVSGEKSHSASDNQLRAAAREPLFQFTVNGQPVLHPPEASLSSEDLGGSSLRQPQPQLYPTVSLFSEETRVWCRFCEADIIYKSRTAIGAPPGVKVYCLDGSLLLHESD